MLIGYWVEYRGGCSMTDQNKRQKVDGKRNDERQNEKSDQVETLLYDPFAHHFTSANRKNDFLKSLEKGLGEIVYSTIH